MKRREKASVEVLLELTEGLLLALEIVLVPLASSSRTSPSLLTHKTVMLLMGMRRRGRRSSITLTRNGEVERKFWANMKLFGKR